MLRIVVITLFAGLATLVQAQTAAPTAETANTRAMNLLSMRIAQAIQHFEKAEDFGKLTIELNFESGRAMNNVIVTTTLRDRL